MRKLLFIALVNLSCFVVPAFRASGQTSGLVMDTPGESQSMQEMPGMDTDKTTTGEMSMSAGSLIESLLHHATSGTDAEPNSTPFGMLMATKGNWTLMFHGEAFLSDIQQSGPRGGDKLFSTNWWMPMVQRKFGKGTLTIRTMLSFEPATVSDRRYPELFQQGETAFGRPIVDGQHPHDFFMELAALYDYKVGERTLLSVYAAPMGDPAMGPPAYPHRASASEDPIAPLGHHLQDSTHIAADVVTAGLTYRSFRLEASGFHGREPDEFRWNIDSGKIDSWSARVTANPGQNWSLQYSIAQLHSPEALTPDEDIQQHDRVGPIQSSAAKGKLGITAALGEKSGYSWRERRQQLSARIHAALSRSQLRLDSHRECGSHQRASSGRRIRSRRDSTSAISPGCKPTPRGTKGKSATSLTSPPHWERNLPGTACRTH